MSTTITYKGNILVTATNQTKTLKTAGKYLEDDITITDVTSGPSLQTKSVTPSETAQVITADSGYDGLDEVDVAAISSDYVGSGITRRSALDLSLSGTFARTPAGYYEAASLLDISGAIKNVQHIQSTTRTASTTLIKLSGDITVAKTGTYDVYWVAVRTSTSGTWGTRFYINSTPYGTANITDYVSNVQKGFLESVSLTRGQKVSVYGLSRGSGYYAYVPMLLIIEK